ncbi:hypothetical protein GQ54DRAFT_256490 [Martensiomyces pterosporus]|nr:hypothetical protein GQ54DRAFT_256490 [Martensiomyces pterosporus]
MGEEDVLRSTIGRLERELDAAQREAATTRIKWQEAERQNAEIEAQKKKLAADLRTVRSNASMVKTQFLHDSKKREQESIKLKERLQKLITDKHRSAKLSVDLVNPIARDRSGRPVDGSSRDQRLLEELIGKYEANEMQLVSKVDGLEDTLRRLAASLSKLHGDVVNDGDGENGLPAAAAANGGETSPSTADAPRGGACGSLLDIASALAMVDSIRNRVNEVRNQKVVTVDQSEVDKRDQQIAELRQEIARLQKEVEDLKKILAEQKKVMEMVSTSGFAKSSTATINALEASFSEMSMEQLELEREALRREKEQLEEERRRFTEAAIELGNERSELKKEREEFDKQKTSKGTADLMSGLPPTPQWMKGIDTSLATPMILHQLQSIYQGTPTNALLASMASMAGGAGDSSTMETADEHSSRQQQRPLEEEFPEIDDGYRSQTYQQDETEHGADHAHASEQGEQSPRMRGASSSSGRALAGGSYHSYQRPTGSQSHTHRSTTPSRPTPTRTPVEIRSGRQARVCTRPGCAAHAPHTHAHEDGSTGARMELKPPVPRFRKRTEMESTPTSTSRPGVRSRQDTSAAANKTPGTSPQPARGRPPTSSSRNSSTMPPRTASALRNSTATSTSMRSPSRRAAVPPSPSSAAAAGGTGLARASGSSSAASRTHAASIFK